MKISHEITKPLLCNGEELWIMSLDIRAISIKWAGPRNHKFRLRDGLHTSNAMGNSSVSNNSARATHPPRILQYRECFLPRSTASEKTKTARAKKTLEKSCTEKESSNDLRIMKIFSKYSEDVGRLLWHTRRLHALKDQPSWEDVD